MANTTLNLVDGLSLDDIVVKSISPIRYVKSLEDTLLLDEVFEKINNVFHVLSFEDTFALGEVFSHSEPNSTTFNFEDGVILGEEFNIITTIRTDLDLDDILTLIDDFIVLSTERSDVDFNDSLSLTDILELTSTSRSSKGYEESMGLTDTFVIQYGLQVVGGTGSGNYDVGEIIQLGPTVPDNKVFFKWNFNKVGIVNIYDPNTTLTMPQGGGIVTAEYIDLLTINDVVVVYDVFDFEFIDNGGVLDDEIITNRTTTPAGGDMGVANHDFEIPQGALFHNIIVYKDNDGNPIDLSGYTAEMQIRKFKAADDPSILTLNTSNGYLALGGELGTITIAVPGSITDDLDFKWGYYDLELYPAGDTNNTVRILEGRIELSKQVTR